MVGVCLGDVHSRKPCIGQEGIDYVAFDLEAFVTGRHLAKISGQQVGECHAAALGIDHEQTVATF